MAVTTSDHTLSTADGPMRLYEAKPDGTPRGAAIVIMEAFGVNDHIEDVTRRTAAAGYHAVSPDLFHRGGGGVARYDEFPKVMELFKTVTDEGILVDIDATIDYLNKAGFANEKIAIFGFCFGGRVAFLTAARRKLGAAVTYYGGGIVSKGPLPFDPLVDEAGSVQTPWMGHFGDLDKGIPVEDVETLRTAMDNHAKVPHSLYRYVDADHGFHCNDRTPVYNPTAASQAWDRTLDWLNQHIG